MKNIFVFILFLMLMVPLARTVIAAPAGPVSPAQTSRLPVSGTIQTLETYNNVSPDMVVTATGSGEVTAFGRFAMSYKLEWNLLDLATTGTAYFVTPNGDSLQAQVMGQATESPAPGVYNVVEIYTITGGTGQFENASGALTLRRLVNRTTGVNTSTFEGMLLMKS